MGKIREKLEEAIIRQLEEVLSEDSEDGKSQAIDDLKVLYQLKLEEDKAIVGAEQKDKEQKLQQENVKLDRLINMGTRAAELVVPLAFYAFWMTKGFKFEETGTISSQVFRNLITNFKPTKKK